MCLEMIFLVVSLLSLINPSQVMFIVKLSPTALNFDFVFLVHFFWDTLYKLIKSAFKAEIIERQMIKYYKGKHIQNE